VRVDDQPRRLWRGSGGVGRLDVEDVDRDPAETAVCRAARSASESTRPARATLTT
jgi:hypothetical protein